MLTARATMRASVLVAPGQLRLREVAVPEVGERELLVQVIATGVCGSDLAAYRGTHPYKAAPAVLGHELCGRVVHAGPRVDSARVGDLVCSAAFSACGRCPACTRSAEHLCESKRSLSHGGWGGAFAEYVLLADDMTFRLPAGLDPVLGALVEPLAIALHGVTLARPRPGCAIAILGAGSIGLCAAIAARQARAAAVVCSDVRPEQGERALACGATGFVSAGDGDLLDGFAAAGCREADAAIVCSGHPGVLDEAARLVKPGGDVVVISYFDGPATADLNRIVSRELAIRGSALATPGEMREVIGWLRDGTVDPRPLIGRRFELAEAGAAMVAVADGAGGKAIIEIATRTA